jgi:predicted ribosomally synthesized peptide with SipW-like signal peptide
MTDDTSTLSRRKVLGAVGTIGGAAALGGTSTLAFFSDEEEFANNQLTAGSLDLKVDWEEHYSDWSDDEADGLTNEVYMDSSDVPDDLTVVGLPDPTDPLIYVASEDLSTFMDNTAVEAYPDTDDDGVQDEFAANPGETTGAGVGYVCEDGADSPEDLDPNGGTGLRTAKRADDPNVRRGAATLDENGDPLPLIDITDVKPGDFGEVTFSMHLCDNPGLVWLQADNLQAAENGLTEAEREDVDEDGDPDSTDPEDVELLDAVQTTWWYDDGDNVIEGSDDTGTTDTADVVVVMDTSGSMDGTKLDNAKEGAKDLVDAVGDGVDVGLVPFANNASVTASLGTANSAVKTAIDDLSAGGGTNLGAGISTAQNELASNGRSDADKFIVALTNGNSFSGRSEATSAKDAGTTIYGIAYGDGADQNLIEDISSPPKNDDGSITDEDQFAFVGDTTNIADVFDDIGGRIGGGEEVFFRGSLREALTLLTTDDGVLLDGNPSTDGVDPFGASTTQYIGFAWYLPVDHANEIQTDSVGFDLTFYAEQARHNEAAMGNAPSGGSTT